MQIAKNIRHIANHKVEVLFSNTPLRMRFSPIQTRITENTRVFISPKYPHTKSLINRAKYIRTREIPII